MALYSRISSLGFLFIALSSLTVMTASTATLPDKFLGRFKLERSENFDEFLASKGVNWFLRKMIGLAGVTKVFRTSTTQPGTYDAENLTSKKNTLYGEWRLNETFRAEGFDGKMHEISFNYDPVEDVLTEKHVRMDNPDDKGETYSFKMENNQLVMTMKNDQVTCKRYFTKEN